MNAAMNLKKTVIEFHGLRLWGAKHWLGSQEPSETGLDDAGSQQ
jgi:hypothetical protein